MRGHNIHTFQAHIRLSVYADSVSGVKSARYKIKTKHQNLIVFVVASSAPIHWTYRISLNGDWNGFK